MEAAGTLPEPVQDPVGHDQEQRQEIAAEKTTQQNLNKQEVITNKINFITNYD
jgi:hypothetical protein